MARQPDRGLALVGYRGTGKSTVGRILADRLGWPFADADLEIEVRVGKPIGRIFAELGEPAFRDREEEVLRTLTRRPRIVLATGGGAVLRPTNRTALRQFGSVAWLTAEPETLAERLRADPAARPALTTAGLLDEIAAVLKARTPLYRDVADLTVDTSRLNVAEVADAVLEAWRRPGTGTGGDP